MKRQLIALCISSILVGSGIVFNMNQDVSVPTVEKFTEDTSLSASKHETTVMKLQLVNMKMWIRMRKQVLEIQ